MIQGRGTLPFSQFCLTSLDFHVSRLHHLCTDDHNCSWRGPVWLRTPWLSCREGWLALQAPTFHRLAGTQQPCRQLLAHFLVGSTGNRKGTCSWITSEFVGTRLHLCVTWAEGHMQSNSRNRKVSTEAETQRYCLSSRWQMHRAIVWVLKASVLYSLQTEWQPRVIMTRD